MNMLRYVVLKEKNHIVLSLRKDVYMQLNDNHAMEPREGIFLKDYLV